MAQLLTRVLLCLLLGLLAHQVCHAQYNEKLERQRAKERERAKRRQDSPARLRVGGSLGIGGAHLIAKPSLDLHYGVGTVRLAPGLFYATASGQLRFGRPAWASVAFYRPMFVELAYHDDYLLARSTRPKAVLDEYIVTLMIGRRIKLEPSGNLYLEGSVGIAYEEQRRTDLELGSYRQRYYPMVGIRLGGMFSLRRTAI